MGGPFKQKPRRSGASSEWARLGSNQRPLACEASALPLSYAPGRGAQSSLAGRVDLQGDDRVDLHVGAARQRGRLDRHARGSLALEELGVDLVHALEVVHVREVDSHAHGVREAGAGRLADGGRGSRGSDGPDPARPP